MTAFVDTSALYALLVSTERHHLAVLDSFRSLAAQGDPLRTTSYVIVETVALLQHRIGLAPVLDLDDKLLPLLGIEWVGAQLHRKGMARLRRQGRRRLSLVDCVSFEFMRAANITVACALDQHFAEAGFDLIPDAAL